MKRPLLFCISALLISSCSFSFTQPIISINPGSDPSLQTLTTKTLFSFKDEKDKEKLNEQLKTGGEKLRNSLSFKGLIVEDLDLSGMDLSGIDFSGGTFIDVNFGNADLRNTRFKKCKFKRVSLENALLLEDFRVQNWSDHYGLVKQYSDLIKDYKKNKNLNSKLRASCLNKFFSALGLNLYNENLQNFDLTDIALENVSLCEAYLQGAILSENVVVPNYSLSNRTPLFNLLMDEDLEKKSAYNSLFHARFNMISGVDVNRLREFLEKNKKDLRNVYLMDVEIENINLSDTNLERAILGYAKLQKANLIHANLKECNLFYTNLREANLTHADLRGADLLTVKLSESNMQGAKLAEAKLSNNFVLPNNCEDKDLIGIYNNCTNKEDKKQLKDILDAKKISISK